MELQKTDINPDQIKITGGFWKQKMELVRTEMIPYQWNALNDNLPDAEPSYCMRNYRIAGKILKGEIDRNLKEDFVFQPLPESKEHLEDTFYGFAFQDSDFSKWLEAVAYSLRQHPDPALEKLADEAIDIVCDAQTEEGYLDTYFTIRNPEAIFTNLRDYHELYCFGHLALSAVAYYETTGKNKLLNATLHFADFITEKIGPENGKLHGYPGHELAEMALVRLYETTGTKKYLQLAKYFIDERGTKPYFFDEEQANLKKNQEQELSEIDFTGAEENNERYAYHQAHKPVREQTEAVGHAVRAMYLYSGMADVAKYAKDESLFEACENLWDNVVSKKMYITGGIGSTHIGEAFTHDYDLPSDTAYAETCAAIGLVFWAKRMLEHQPKSSYADIMERALYNAVLSGMSLDGTSFFYVNPLECRPKDCKYDERKKHIKTTRQKWFSCACCPPNLARLLTSLDEYMLTKKDDIFYIHLFIDSIIPMQYTDKNGNMKDIFIYIKSDVPYSGKVEIFIEGLEKDEKLQMALRLPDWTKEFTVNEVEYAGAEPWERVGNQYKDGYFFIPMYGEKTYAIEFSMPIRYVQPNRNISELAGKVTIMRGPLVYCAEAEDNGNDLHLLHADPSSKPEFQDGSIYGEKVIFIQTKGLRERPELKKSKLYHEYQTHNFYPVTIHWIPYYMWANRGENEMRVWLREVIRMK